MGKKTSKKSLKKEKGKRKKKSGLFPGIESAY